MKCPNCRQQLPLTLLAQELGQLGGSKSTPAKRKASRENGKLGGRPKKGAKR